ncbi:hypothetical protein BH23GEM10_BH23GEM10_08220 [soil metagenome]
MALTAQLSFVARSRGAGQTVVLRAGHESVVIDPDGSTAVDTVGVSDISILISSARDRCVAGAHRLIDALRRQAGPPRVTLWCPDGVGGAELPDTDVALDSARPGSLFALGPLEVSAFATSHGDVSRGYAFHLAEGAPPILVYAGHTRPCYATVEAARRAQLLVHDASYHNADGRLAGRRGRSTSGEAARVADAAGVDQLVLNPSRALPAEQQSRVVSEASRLFRNTRLATDGLAFDLSAAGLLTVHA